MTVLGCDRCGTLFDPHERFTTADVEVLGRASRETVAQVLLCGTCTAAVGDSLSLETSIHDRSQQ